MTETTPTEGAPTAPARPQVVENLWSIPDEMLQLLVQLAQDSGFEISVTLQVPGGTVTGVLVGRNAWLESLALAHSNGDVGSFTKALRDGFTAEPRGEDEPPARWTWIHLRDARIMAGDRWTPSEGVFWRGRLSEVSGWFLGSLS